LHELPDRERGQIEIVNSRPFHEFVIIAQFPVLVAAIELDG
jgi:hypothetical protein